MFVAQAKIPAKATAAATKTTKCILKKLFESVEIIASRNDSHLKCTHTQTQVEKRTQKKRIMERNMQTK